MVIVVSPIIALIALSIRIKMGSPVLFSQERVGIHNSVFTFYKFRTMTPVRSDETGSDQDVDRITPLGAWLRNTSLDEIPQLFNVIKGDMLFVGPRPLLVEYLPLYTKRQAKRHDVKPGITGWAQVNGRNSTSWEEKFELDAWYVENRSFWLDLKILWMTLKTVAGRKGINQSETRTMEKFTGNPGQ